MSLWSKLFGRKSGTDQNRFWLDMIGGSRTTGGVPVTQDSAMRNPAVWACVLNRAEDTAKLPCHLYRRRKDGGKERATDHPVYRLIHDQANYRHTAFEFKQLMQMQVDLDGNAYAIKEFNGRGEIVALWPVESRRVQILKSVDGRELFYRFNLYNETVTLPAEAVFHLRGNSLDGICGMSPIAWQREAIGHNIAAEKYGAAFFGNSAQPNGALVVPNKISPEAADMLRKDWKNRFQGPENAHNLAIFDTGMDWKQIGMNNADAQFIEARKMQNSEIWRIYRMPPHTVGDLEKATFSNIEQQSLDYVQGCLMAIFARWEQALARDLLLDSERAEYFFEFLPDALLKGDIKSRFEAYALALTNGIFCINDCLDRENMNHVEFGDIRYRPMNLQPIDMPQLPPKEPTPAPAKPKRRSKTDA